MIRSRKHDMDGEHSDDLLRRALIDAEAAASVALRVAPLTLSETLTVVFHGRRDLGTIQTYVAHGGEGVAGLVGALRDAVVGAYTGLEIWREPLEYLAQDHIRVDRRIRLDVRL